MADDAVDQVDATESLDASTDESADLRDECKRALDRMKADKSAAEKARKAAEKRASDLEQRLSQIEEANKSEADKAIEGARKEAAEAARAEVLTELHRERINNALMRHAGKFADPEDVLTIADGIDVGDDGRPDPAEVERAVNDLLERKPHWAANGRKYGDVGQGMRQQSPPLDPRAADLAQIEADLKAGARRLG